MAPMMGLAQVQTEYLQRATNFIRYYGINSTKHPYETQIGLNLKHFGLNLNGERGPRMVQITPAYDHRFWIAK